MATAQTAKTQYTTGSDGIRYAYRTLGPLHSAPRSHSTPPPPLLLHTHHRANMDMWDPSLANALAAHRRVVLFDAAGVGRSSGAVATTFGGWAAHVLALAGALGLRAFDVAGFSMGGAAAQMVALAAPAAVRRLVVRGSTASAPAEAETGAGLVWPREGPPPGPVALLAGGEGERGAFEGIAGSFFGGDEEGREHARAYWARVHERSVEGEPLMLEMLGDEGSKRQRLAYADWAAHSPANSWDRFKELKMPVLVMNGDNDVLIPSSRSWEMTMRIPAQLIIYPRSGHGFLYQYAELVAAHINMFLDGDGAGSARL